MIKFVKTQCIILNKSWNVFENAEKRHFLITQNFDCYSYYTLINFRTTYVTLSDQIILDYLQSRGNFQWIPPSPDRGYLCFELRNTCILGSVQTVFVIREASFFGQLFLTDWIEDWKDHKQAVHCMPGNLDVIICWLLMEHQREKW